MTSAPSPACRVRSPHEGLGALSNELYTVPKAQVRSPHEGLGEAVQLRVELGPVASDHPMRG